ncbi:CGNR zinc finger domain-containing protein [Mycobacterium barrassiae]|uniref:CGNR zinc finger domain-containing protein n=1 Tax=Mycobacterium barrassiae TaxID=319709 RepID=UPI002265EF2B|nr:CGNR zinc finger domain-containing protein [Mycobacterium barrassiae]MCV7298957.1 CGNR zinc finger domain-containing protein [Mycobacterium barrassiae]
MDLVAISPSDEALLLDLLNTTPVIDGIVHDGLADSTAAKAWMRAHGIAATKEEEAALVEARSTLQKVVRGEIGTKTLKRFVADVRLRPVVDGDGLDWRLDVEAGATGAARAVLAWDALRISSPGRLRPCANSECRLFLIDRSKPNTARWCSMAICGNRMKARRHYRRARSADA